MIVDCVSDLHGHYPELEGGDLLIVAGDLTERDELYQYAHFDNWIQNQKYEYKVLIGGNHDNMLQNKELSKYGFLMDSPDFKYLCDSGTKASFYPALTKDMPYGKLIERKDFKIWGSPWTHTFPGQNPKCKAFSVDIEEELSDIFARIPDDVDILVTHSPPYTILDRTKRGEQVGSTALMAEFIDRLRPKLWVFGHIHEGYGHDTYNWRTTPTILVNASHVNEDYEPVNKPIRVIL